MESKNGTEAEMASEPCSQCGEVPESIVLLACEHKLCFSCTVDAMGEALLTCPVCEGTTTLTPELLQALNEIQREDDSPSKSDSPVEGELETSVMLAGVAVTPPRALPPCPTHPDEQLIYFNPAHRELLCAQCASGTRMWDELWPLQRCLPQTLEHLAQPFREAELAARRLALRRGELDLQGHALRLDAVGQAQRLEDALDAIAETVAQLKIALKADVTTCLEAGLARLAERRAALQLEEERLTTLSKEFWRLREESSAGEVLVFAGTASAELAPRDVSEEDGLAEEITSGLETVFVSATSDAYEKLLEKLHRVPEKRVSVCGSARPTPATSSKQWRPAVSHLKGSDMKASEATLRFGGYPNGPSNGGRDQTFSRTPPPTISRAPYGSPGEPLRFSFIRTGVRTVVQPQIRDGRMQVGYINNSSAR